MIRRLAFVAVFSTACAVACSGPSKGGLQFKVSTRAQPASFRENGVSTVFEKRCGTLDCHGSIYRNLRIYSAGGLRLPNDAGNAPGVGDTTLDEQNANYQSIIYLEPEKMNDVIGNNGDPDGLLLLKKPEATESHKGGQQLKKGDPADKCIRSWLTENPVDMSTAIDKNACAQAAIFPQQPTTP